MNADKAEMKIDRDEARRVAEALVKASALCDKALRVVMSNDSLGQSQVFGKLAGRFMGNVYANVLAPIWQAFPDLEPREMNGLHVEHEPALSPASREAIDEFLRQAHAALAWTEGVFAGDRATDLRYGGIAELREYVSEIEPFLVSPRYRDPQK